MGEMTTVKLVNRDDAFHFYVHMPVIEMQRSRSLWRRFWAWLFRRPRPMKEADVYIIDAIDFTTGTVTTRKIS